MPTGDVFNVRPICASSKAQVAALAACCVLSLAATLCVAHVSRAEQPPTTHSNAVNQTKAVIRVTAEPVVRTQTNPFAIGIEASTNQKPTHPTVSVSSNPFSVPAIVARPADPVSSLPTSNAKPPVVGTAVGNPHANTSWKRSTLPTPPKSPFRLPSVASIEEQAHASIAQSMKRPAAIVMPKIIVRPAATKLKSTLDAKPAVVSNSREVSKSHVVDSMALDGALIRERKSNALLPALSSSEEDGFTLAAPQEPIASPSRSPISMQPTVDSLPPAQARNHQARPATHGISRGWISPSLSHVPPSPRPDLGQGNLPQLTDEQAIAIEDPPSQTLVSPAPRQVPNVISHGSMGRFLDSYRVRASETIDDTSIEIIDPQAMFAATGASPPQMTTEGTEGFDMWWEPQMIRPIGFTPRSLSVDVGTLTQSALVSSPFVRGLLTKPHIRRSDIVIADAEFDPAVFLEGRFTDTSDPVGSALTTGDNSDRFRDETFTANGGVRKKTRKGAELELAQRGGFQENNSTFLDPNPQGTTRLEFNFTQPLMRDRGCAVNNIRVLLAQLDLQINNAEVRGDLEDHLVSVTRAYWDLYQARAQWLQRKRLLDRAIHLHGVLEARQEVDSHQRQILRARAALTSRKSDLVRITTRIRDAQSRLRLLTGSEQLIESQNLELTPQDQPLEFPVAVSTRQSVITALDNRSDIARAIRRIQAVSARVGVARNQVLPRLDLILGTYISGLDDNRDTFGAWENQFSQGRPTYWAGLAYELPVGNRASKARLNRNRWEMSQVMHEFQQATEVAFTEVEVAVRETQTAYNVMVAKKQSIDAAANEVNFLQQRWELLPDPNESAVLLIEDLLEAQERLADEEQAFVAAQVAYAMSWIALRKVTGVLLRFDDADLQPVMPDSHSIQPADLNRFDESISVDESTPVFEPIEEETPHVTIASPRATPSATTMQPASYSSGNNFRLKDSLR